MKTLAGIKRLHFFLTFLSHLIKQFEGCYYFLYAIQHKLIVYPLTN